MRRYYWQYAITATGSGKCKQFTATLPAAALGHNTSVLVSIMLHYSTNNEWIVTEDGYIATPAAINQYMEVGRNGACRVPVEVLSKQQAELWIQNGQGAF